MTNGEKFKEIFGISQVDEGELYAYMWLPSHDAVYIPRDWWNAEYKEPTTNNDVPENNVGKIEPTTKNDLAVDCVSREKVWYMITNGKYPNEDYEQFIDRLVNELSELPSVTPQYSSELEKNSKKLEKDFGELDCISRADAIRVASGYCHPSNVAKELAKLPSVTPQEPIKKLEEQIKQLQNRCHALTHGQICVFCPYECEHKAETEPQESEK